MYYNTNIKFISNWNIDGIPFNDRTVNYKINKTREINDLCTFHYINRFSNINPDNYLFIGCFQECWSIKNLYLLKLITKQKNNTIFDIIIIIFVIIISPILFFNIDCDQSNILYNEISGIIPYNYVIGNKGFTKSKIKLVDSGLCILSNWKPVYKNFYKFKTSNSITKGEFLINRGILFGLFIDNNDKVSTLVFNIQVSREENIKKFEINELIKYVKQYKKRFNSTLIQEVIIVGDFNSKLTDKSLIKLMLSLKVICVSSKTIKNQISHIFYWRNDIESNLKFICSNPIKTSISKYPWNSVILEKY